MGGPEATERHGKHAGRPVAVRGWKQVERRIAAILGGRRIPVSGRGRGDNPDIDHPALCVEVKARASFPAWLEDALKQAELSATEGKTPAVVLHQDRRKYPDALVVCRLSEFAGLVGSRSDTPNCQAK